MKLLFVSNKRSIPGGDYSCTLESGLVNSIRFIVEMLNNNGIESKYVQVDDANRIDREVSIYKPTTVILEAIWVTPKKLHELTYLHPKTKWIIRIHSKIPFLAHEGVAIEWLSKYSYEKNVSIAFNNNDAIQEIEALNFPCPLLYLPNYYGGTILDKFERVPFSEETLHVGCLGAIRPLKNQLIQAIAAIGFADSLKQPLHFHINVNREETGGNSVLKNIRALFKSCPTTYKLIEHPWTSHKEFIEVVKLLDVSMQVSFSETFNIISADAVANRIPVVVSPEVNWLPMGIYANPTEYRDIICTLKECRVMVMGNYSDYAQVNINRLIEYNQDTVQHWKRNILK